VARLIDKFVNSINIFLTATSVVCKFSLFFLMILSIFHRQTETTLLKSMKSQLDVRYSFEVFTVLFFSKWLGRFED